MSNEYTPDADLLRDYWIDANSFEDDPAEAGKEFDRAIAKIRAEAVRDAASGLIDWDIMYGHESESSVSKVSHANAAYLMRVADDFERGGH